MSGEKSGNCEDCGRWFSVLYRLKAGMFCRDCRPKHREKGHSRWA